MSPESDPSKAAAAQQAEQALQALMESYFDEGPEPAVLCDGELTILKANLLFGQRVEAQSSAALVGRPLGEVLELQLPNVRNLEATIQRPVRLPGGTMALANLKPLAGCLLISLDLSLEGDRLARARRALEDQGRVFAIGRLLSLLMTEDDLVGVTAQALGDFFAGRQYCIRTVDPENLQLLSFYAEGELKPEARRQLRIKRSAVRKLRLEVASLKSEIVRLGEHYEPIFEGTELGLGVPLVAGGQLLGMINVEGSAAQFDDLKADERLAIGLSNQLSIALRNARLLQESRYLRGYLEQLIAQANALVLAVDRRGRVQVFNKACEALTGFSQAQVKGRPVEDLVVPARRQRIRGLLDQALGGQSVENLELTVQRRDGKQHPVAVNAAPILGRDGVVESVVIIGHDLGRLMELEAQVVHAEKLASLGQLATAVVHELNNPLTSIVAYADALHARLELLGDAKDLTKVERISEASERILKFTRDLLAYARPGQATPILIRPEELLESSLRLCEHLLAESGVQLERNFDASLPSIRGNQGHLQQVLVNLMTNACHAMDRGGQLSLSASLIGELVELRVEDNGPGVSAELAERIFEPFFSTKAPGKGTGLGLSIVREIIERHGGTIELLSQAGHGACFLIQLPAAQA